jgi:spindle assembly abnormal protein 6
MNWTESIPNAKFRCPDNDSLSGELCLKFSGSRQSGYLFEVTSESDLFFLYMLRLTESDYHSLKTDQRLLVDFAQFPDMVRELVRGVTMTVVFQNANEEGSLSVLEVSQFRELVHLTLKFKKGADDAVKTNLVNKLNWFKTRTNDLESRNASLARELNFAQESREKAIGELGKCKSDFDNQCLSVRSQCAADLAVLREEHARELRRITTDTSAEFTDESRRLNEDLNRALDKLRATERDLDAARMALSSWESRCTNAERRVRSLEGHVENGKETINKSLTEAKEVVCKNFELEKKIAEFSTETLVLRDQIGHIRSSLVDPATYQSRIHDLESQLEAKTQLIVKLQTKLRDQKHALKQTQEALVTQESVVKQLEQSVASSAHLPDKLTQLESQLVDAKRSLESNSQVISFLNNKLSGKENSMFATIGTTPSLSTPTIPEDYPLRSRNITNLSDVSSLEGSSMMSKPSRILNGPVKFTARTGGSKPLIK